MKKMLNKSPLSRLCKFSHIKTDPWFSSFSWDNLISLIIEPPYLPKLKKEEESKGNPVSYSNYLKTVKEWKPTKEYSIDKKTQIEYDKWFKCF